ncbi:TolC family protein [Bradyrhizobium diazoefficiens]|nr:TolC family protein [Bradyrhizobium diazoefficiens]MBR0965633.1 TolC family protein [Bradyrhizobium diazoefficiens]MBR0979325.1 TolC family protein [Bradyrhizobium diazoefficiens]MBR1008717.1 TolC family protein [Bradyrhizobium diazoefficiens]MBR1014734.1 TolC family protein [Bradyrhizobium diazoefficiens]MBR1052678.1 TolC family protein [Bradyrhizobium diazoefficiens]
MFSKCATRFACAMALLVSPWLTAVSHSQTLNMGAALQRALATSPRLTAAERDVGIATGQRIQAGALLNPELSYEQDNSFGSGIYRGTKSAETTLQISQLFELFGKREARIAAGQAGVEGAAIERKAVRLQILSETAIAFLNVLGLQRRIQILDDQVTALERLTPLLQRRVDAGASSPAETGRAEVAAALVKADRERTKASLSSARRELAVLMGDTVPKFASVSGRLDATTRAPSFQAVIAAIDANPQLVRWNSIYAQRNAELLLARLKPYPDVRLAAGWRHFNETNDDAVRLTLSVPIPVFDQNQGNILSAQESLAKTRAEREANRNILLVVAGRAYDTVQGSLRELSALRDTGIPKAQAAANEIEQGYGAGRFTLLEVLDAQANVTQARLREQEALQNYHVAVATIEGLVGNPFSLARESAR